MHAVTANNNGVTGLHFWAVRCPPGPTLGPGARRILNSRNRRKAAIYALNATNYVCVCNPATAPRLVAQPSAAAGGLSWLVRIPSERVSQFELAGFSV